MPLLSARVIWYVALMVCCKQLLRVFSHRQTQQQLLSVVGLFAPPFTSFESVHSGSAAGPGRLYCLTTAILQCDCPQSFILWSAGEFTDRCGIRLTREKNMNADPSKRLFFFLAADERGTGTKPEIRGRRKKKDVWQSARWAIYEMDSGHSVLGRKWKTSEYEMFGLSLEVANQGGDTGRSEIRKYIERRFKQERQRKPEHCTRESERLITFGLTSWSRRWGGLEALMRTVTTYWSRRSCIQRRRRLSGNRPGRNRPPWNATVLKSS